MLCSEVNPAGSLGSAIGRAVRDSHRHHRKKRVAGFVVAVLRRMGQENILEDGGPFR
jgi:hypothetical protein